MSCPQNGREGREKQHLEKSREKNSARKKGGGGHCWGCLFLNERNAPCHRTAQSRTCSLLVGPYGTQAPQRPWSSSFFPLIRSDSVAGTNSQGGLKGAKSSTEELLCLENLGGMPLQGHLISVASPLLFLLILWTVRIQSLSENMTSQMKTPPLGPHQMPGPWPGHGWGLGRSSPPITHRYL